MINLNRTLLSSAVRRYGSSISGSSSSSWKLTLNASIINKKTSCLPLGRALHYKAAEATDTELLNVINQRKTDVLVLGCGVAGCSAALKAAERGLNVTMVTSATDPLDCNSYWAQGGIIYKAKDDSPALLASDIMIAGAGVNDPQAVNKLAVEGPSCVEDLLLRVAQVPFDRNAEGGLALCLEASHNRARIIHWRDHTGRAITESLQHAVNNHPNILLLSGVTAVDLATTAKVNHNINKSTSTQAHRCLGAHVIRVPTTSGAANPIPLRAQATVLATGGLGDIYQHTSNPASAKGDGFAMAFRGGAALQNMEYVQFHPTTLYLPGERSFLLTEALRGEGARLINLQGEAFAKRYHRAGELAPRDIVSRMIVSEMKVTGDSHVLLDISHRDAKWLCDRFPSINAHCLARGLDMTRDALPVVPAAHYFCGGVVTDLKGQTSLPGLYAAGEVACTGLHGANRLASTSLLEGLVWGVAIADHLASLRRKGMDTYICRMADSWPLAPLSHTGGAEKKVANHADVEALMDRIRSVMWEHVGVVRRHDGLDYASGYLRRLEEEVNGYYLSTQLSKETVSLRNMVETARLIARAAARNQRSVGTHYVESEEDEEEHQSHLLQVAQRVVN